MDKLNMKGEDLYFNVLKRDLWMQFISIECQLEQQLSSLIPAQ